MNQSILRVKITIPPLGTGILPRPRLRETLEQNLREAGTFLRRLTLVSAPAGYGKTTQIRSWLAGQEESLAWYSLDEFDDEPARFWTHLIAALQVPAPGVGSASAEVLRSLGPDPDREVEVNAHLVPLLNDLFRYEDPLFLVLDDYHHIQHSTVHREMVFFLENLPPSVHVIVTTRSDPPWPLARWRAGSVMGEIRLDELRFNAEEVGKLCAERTGLSLEDAQLAILTEKTEGWIAGLQLAVHSLLSHREEVGRFLREFDGSHRHVLHFLSEEIFLRQSPEMQTFLLRTSVLHRFCAPLCDAVTGGGDGEELIEKLVRENLFVLRLDDRGTWYRYHALFADLLRYRLIRTDPEAVPDLHRRASRWFLSRNMLGQAVRHALQGEDMSSVVRILEEHHDEILLAEGPGQLIRCVDDLPEEHLCRSPILILFKALYFLNYFGLERAEPYLTMVEELEYDSEEDQRRFRGMHSTVLAFRSVYSHRLDRAIEHAQEALRTLPRSEHIWRMRVAIYSGDARLFSGRPVEAYPFYEEAHRSALRGINRFLPLTTGLKLATTLYYLGRLEEAWEMTREMLATARKEGLAGIPRMGLHWGLLGELNREYGNLEEAERCLERALVMGEEEKPSWGWNSLYMAALHHSRREPEKVLERVRSIEHLNREVSLPAFVTTGATVWKARGLVSLGKDGEALRELGTLGVGEGDPVPPGMERAGLVLARILAGKAEGAAALPELPALLELLEERARTGGELRLLVEALLLRARYAESIGKNGEAKTAGEAARTAGSSAGFYQVFLDEDSGNASTAPPPGARAPAASSGLVEDLSEREREILLLVDQGLSNDDIGRKLFISPGTVKWHLSNVFGKLGVSKRTRAIAVAREMGLLG